MQHMNTISAYKIGPKPWTSEMTMMINGLLLGCYDIAWIIINNWWQWTIAQWLSCCFQMIILDVSCLVINHKPMWWCLNKENDEHDKNLWPPKIATPWWLMVPTKKQNHEKEERNNVQLPPSHHHSPYTKWDHE
jgi:hypothetical protein